MPNDTSSFLDHSDEVQDILGQVPQWIVRWGSVFFFGILLTISLGSYFIKYPTVISAPFTLTTKDPPIPLIPKTTGRIEAWFVQDGQYLDDEQAIALLENTAIYDHIMALEDMVETARENLVELAAVDSLPNTWELGELQNGYRQFVKNLRALHDFIQEDEARVRIAMLQSRLRKERQRHELLKQQLRLKKQEIEVATSIFQRDSVSYRNGGYGVIKAQYQESLQTYITRKSSLLSMESSLKSSELTLLDLEDRLFDIRLQNEHKRQSLLHAMNDSYVQLTVQLRMWKNRYLIIAPIKGTITFTEYWSENQTIVAGQRLATIVPSDSMVIIARAVLSAASLGKVEVGQKVQIKLAGFPSTQYGYLHGKIYSISLVPGENGYLAEIELLHGMTSTYSETLKFVQQMNGTADIIMDDTRLIRKLLRPIMSVLN